MPEGDSKKRSRSPSTEAEDDKHQHKRVNTGVVDEQKPAPEAQSGAGEDIDAPADNVASKADLSNASLDAAGEEAAKSDADQSASAAGAAATPSAQIHMRCLIVTQDASIIIGKGGAHVNEIREKSGARVVVSESIPGNPERILNVSGPLDAVSKAFGLIVRRINDEPFDQPSVPGSRAVTIKFMIPNSRMGSVIGKQGLKIKEIQEASGARLNASEGMLPGSTERVLSVAGVADAIHIATYYIGNILLEAQSHSGGSSNANNTTYQYRPAPAAPATTYTARRAPVAPQPVAPPLAAAPAPYYNPYAYAAPPPQFIPPPQPGSQQLQTQQIYIPNELVGSIIGKGGAKINEIRAMSASQIKIMDPDPTKSMETERLVTITGPPANIQMAVTLLYQRLEQEKQKQMMGAGGSYVRR